MAAVLDKSQIIGEFLEWLQSEKGVELIITDKEGEYQHLHKTIEELLAEFFKIDLKKCELERRALLDHIRKTG